MKTEKANRTDNKLAEMIIQRMKQLRAEHKYSQEYLIENTGLNIAHFESGINVPSIMSLSHLCKFYKISLDEFFAPLNYPPKE